MNDNQIKNLKAGDRIVERINGRDMKYLVYEVRSIGTCCLESSGAYGHAYAQITALAEYQEDNRNDDGTPRSTTQFSIESDEYIQGTGYPTHDEQEIRIRGTELITDTRRTPMSRGHIRFAGTREFFLRNGNIYQAPVSNPIMPDGYRCGRWFGYDREDTRKIINTMDE